MSADSVAGLDGCRAGWFVVAHDPATDAYASFTAGSIAEAWSRLGAAAVVGIDIPIGLPDSGPRDADRLARQRLSPSRTSSVFPAPIRPVLNATSHREACDLRESIDGKRMSVQAFHILAKIAEVDRFLRSTPAARERVFEVHPELAFASLNDDQPMAHAKRREPGFAARLQLLTEKLPRDSIDSALDAYPRKDVAKDDVLDAFAVMLAARRISQGQGRRVPVDPVHDSAGLDMAIWF